MKAHDDYRFHRRRNSGKARSDRGKVRPGSIKRAVCIKHSIETPEMAARLGVK